MDYFKEQQDRTMMRDEFEKAFVKDMKWADFVAHQCGTFKMVDGDYAIPEVSAAFRWYKVGRTEKERA